MTTNAPRIRLLAALTVLSLALYSCSLDVDAVPSTKGLGFLEDKIGTKFPKDAKLLAMYEFHGLDETVWAKTEMPSEDIDAFIAPSVFKGNLSSERHLPLGVPDAVRKDWYDGSAKKILSGTVTVHSEGVWVLIDLDDPAKAVVYLMWAGT